MCVFCLQAVYFNDLRNMETKTYFSSPLFSPCYALGVLVLSSTVNFSICVCMRVYHFYFASLPWKEMHQNIQLSLFYTHTILIQWLCGRLSSVAWRYSTADDNVLSAFSIGWTHISAAFRDCIPITVTNWSRFSLKHFGGAVMCVFYFNRTHQLELLTLCHIWL